jgi:glycosyltransferase involved in cell wall biosynthesis
MLRAEFSMTRSDRPEPVRLSNARSDKLFSIVTISFNQARFLRQCLESVISQKASDVEYIVVDPGSTDGSREIIMEYANHIDSIIFEPDLGPADGLNKGFANATGSVGYFINSDDYMLPGAIDAMRRYWTNPPELGLLLGRAWRIRDDGSVERELVPTPNKRAALTCGAVTVVQQGFSFNIEMLRNFGGFNINNRSCWDYELLAKFAQNDAPFRVVTDRFGAFRFYSGGLSGGNLGTTYDLRLDSDYKRIHQEFFDAPIRTTAQDFLRKGKYLKIFKHPSLIFHRALEVMIPQKMKRRFARDLASARDFQQSAR